MKLLFLSNWFPYPPTNGSKLRIYNLLRGLAPHHDITLISFADEPVRESDICHLQSICQDIEVLKKKQFNPHSFISQLGYLSPTPRSFMSTFSPEMSRCIRNKVLNTDFDVAIVSQLGMAPYSKYICCLPIIFEEMELGVRFEKYVNATSAWQSVRYGLSWSKFRRYLAKLLPNSSACTVVSERELYLLSQAVPGYKNIELIPNCVELENYEHVYEKPQPNTLIFTGSFRYRPNYQAMCWFIKNVYPIIQKQIPDVKLTITGDNLGLPLPHAYNVNLTGFVNDVRPVIARSWVSLAPLFTGGGTRFKILEAMALGTPVVATTKGAEGIDVKDGTHLLIADTQTEFADALIRLMSETALHQKIAKNAQQIIREKYNWANVLHKFLDLIENTVNVHRTYA